MRHSSFTLYRDEAGQNARCNVLSVGSGAPHVVLTALQHGNEVLGLEAGLQALQQLEAGIVHGTVTLLACLNPIGFQEGTRNALNRSFDLAGTTQTNLNRLHPGNPNGTFVDRMAYAIDQYITSLQPDYLVDLHTYAVQSVPHVIIDPVDAALRGRLTVWSAASGLPYYHEFAEDNYAGQGLNNCLSGVWCLRGVPAVTVELGPQVGFGIGDVDNAAAAVLHVLEAVNVTEAASALDGQTSAIAAALAGKQWQRAEIENDSPAQGYVRHHVRIGEMVQQGQLLAEIVQLDGRTGARVCAPSGGMVFIWHDDPRAYPGSKLGIMLCPSR